MKIDTHTHKCVFVCLCSFYLPYMYLVYLSLTLFCLCEYNLGLFSIKRFIKI